MARKKLPGKAGGQSGIPVRSMTGFGRATLNGGARRFTAEIRSVNGRFLKLTARVPPGYGAFEERIKAQLTAQGLRRGSVDVGLFFDSADDGGGRYSIDARAAIQYAKQGRALAKAVGAKAALPLQALLLLPGVVKRADAADDLDAVWSHCTRALASALTQWERMRVAEGATLASDIRGRLADLLAHRDTLASAAPEALNKSITRFKERVSRLLEKSGVALPMPAEALEREIVLAADRMDIDEELARLGSHLEQMEAALKEGGEAGKRLDFLTQELLRETNTIGSKANDQAITHLVVAMKGSIEKIREQVQNLE